MKGVLCEKENNKEGKKRNTETKIRFFVLRMNNFSRTQQYFGGGGNRTRVRRYSTEDFYTLILFFILVLRLLKRKNNRKTSPEIVSLTGFKTNLVRYPAGRRLSSAAGKHKRSGLPTL